MRDAQSEVRSGPSQTPRRRFGGTMPTTTDTPNLRRVSLVGIAVTLLLGTAIARYASQRDAAVNALATQIETAMTLRAEELEASTKSIGP